jgi:hypothetical protein
MAAKFRPAERGNRTIYVEHGVWYDQDTKHIHVTIPGLERAHWSYGNGDKKYGLYRVMLQEAGRWPADVE